MKKKTSVLLVNLGTPDNHGLWEVYRYLVQFLNDPRVIDLSFILRFLLVNFIIIPLRLRRSSRRYRAIWTDKGSPLYYHTLKLKEELQKSMDEGVSIHIAMRYGNPSIKKTMENIRKENTSAIMVITLFPQYASSTSGSILEQVMRRVGGWNTIPSLKFIHDFSGNEGFLKVYAEKLISYNPAEYDHVLFSFHSLPVRHINRIHPGTDEKMCDCHREMPLHGRLCYKALCYSTARNIARYAGIDSKRYTVCFQSRFFKNWLSPFTEEVIVRKAKEGIKKMLIAAPSFVTDGLETIADLGVDGNRIFLENGGQHLQLVESLNSSPDWVGVLKDMILKENSG